MQPTPRFHGPLEGDAAGGPQPYAEALVTEDLVLLDVSLPGVDPAAVEISVDSKSVEIRAEAPAGVVFRWQVILPVRVVMDRFVAVSRHGVLEIRLEPENSD